MIRFVRNFPGLVCVLTVSLLLPVSCTVPSGHEHATPIGELDSGWEYRVGDSPADSSGRFVWLDDTPESPRWMPIGSLNELLGEGGQRSLWVRIRLPDFQGLFPAVYVSGFRQISQVWLDDRLIYEFGDFSVNKGDHFQGWRSHLIGLPPDCSGSILSFRIWSGGPYIGMGAPVYLGPADLMLNHLFIDNLDEIMFASLFLFLGAALLVLWLIFHRRRLYLGLFLFIISMGIFTGSNSLFLQTVIHAPRLFFLLDYFSLITVPIGVVMIMEIIIPRFRRSFRRLWQALLVYWGVSLFSVLFLDYAVINQLQSLSMAVLSVSMGLSFILILRSLRRGGREIAVFLSGLLLFYLFAALEILFYFSHRLDRELAFHIGWIHLGALGFVISLIWIVVHRYMETNRQKEAAQQEALESVIQSERLKSQIALKHVESEKYRELDRLKSRFFANISHEFRTPLTLILGSARQVQDRSGDETSRKKLDLLMQNGRRLLRLVNELLDLARLEAGRTPLKVAHMDILPLARRICDAFDSHVRQQDVELVFQSDLDQAWLYIDPDKMEKVLSNLVSNAVKFTPSGGRIEVTVERNELMTIRVADTGPGIAEAHLPHIFDRFYRAEGAAARNQQGSGIGLALARELVKLHHGEITVESETGKGSVFTVTLPLGKEHLTGEPPSVPLVRGKRDSGNPAMSSVASTSSTNETVPRQSIFPPRGGTKGGVENETPATNLPLLLIVEDHADMRAYIVEELSGGYEIIQAEDGLTGFELAARRIPDLVVSDVMMPGMDGYRLCEKLKADERTSHIPLVLLTARSDHESRMSGLSLGADDYLTKPFEPEELKVRVKNLIDQRRKLREHYRRETVVRLPETAFTPADEKFLNRAVELIQSHLDDPGVDVEWFSREMGYSRSQLHRKMTAVTGVSPTEFITRLRLDRAARLLLGRTGSISEIAYEVGFNSPSYFRKCFKEYFKVTPSKYLKSN